MLGRLASSTGSYSWSSEIGWESAWFIAHPLQTNYIAILHSFSGRRFSDLSTASGFFGNFHGISFAAPTKLSQRLQSVYTYILRLASFTRFLEYFGSMIRDILSA
jgi:hypothetical protein